MPAGLALLVGPLRFVPALCARRLGLHRVLGRAYMLAVLVGGLTSAVAAVMSTSGLPAQVGVLLLAASWLWSGLQGFLTIRRDDVASHRVWMIRNYAFTFASVLLRLFLFVGVTYAGWAGEATSLTFGDIYTTIVWARRGPRRPRRPRPPPRRPSPRSPSRRPDVLACTDAGRAPGRRRAALERNSRGKAPL